MLTKLQSKQVEIASAFGADTTALVAHYEKENLDRQKKQYKFLMIIPDPLNDYLEYQLSIGDDISKSEYVRNLIRKDMKRNKDYLTVAEEVTNG